MKLIIEIPEKTNAHIRSDYGHGVKGLYDEDREIVCDAIYHAIPYKERPHGEWIPCSERLPTEEDYRPCYGLPDGCVMWQTDNGDIGFGWYYDSTKCWSDIYDRPIKTGKVISWMPLPEPYKEESKGVRQ